MTPCEPGRVAMALVHYPIRGRGGETAATSVTPLNVHDLARAARTYGVAPFFVVTPLFSQQVLVGRILNHWREGHGSAANPTRTEALREAVLVSGLNEAIDDCRSRFGDYPRLVATGARGDGAGAGYAELAARFAAPGRPWLLLFGTGSGLAPEVTDQCEVLLEPVRGPGTFNHLSVRTAAAVVLDRLFGR